MNTKPRRRSGLWSAIAYFTAVAALVVGIYVITDNNASVDVEPAPAAVGEEITATTVVAAIEVEAPSYVSGEEPIADAAEIILPSVVHIQTDQGLGSGVVYDSSGLIITAAHVVADQDTVLIRFSDGEQVEGTVLGAVSGVDVAVIQVEKDGLEPAVFNTTKPRVGQLAIAVGSPWGLESTVTAGIVSAVDQANCDFGSCFSQVQTDAAINPGNSGGALVDRNGQVIGINVSIRTESGANDGVGFAVPSATVVETAESIISGDLLDTAYLGVRGEPAQGAHAGALIVEVTPGTAAADAGVEVDDVVISFAGVEISGIGDLAAQVRTHRPGDTVEMILIRDSEELTFDVTLGAFPDESSP
jgi:S1-C subfamily serine protease